MKAYLEPVGGSPRTRLLVKLYESMTIPARRDYNGDGWLG